MPLRLLIWLVFGVGSAVLPLFLSGFVIFNHGQLNGISDTWGHGELLLVAMTLLIASFGELIVYGTDFNGTKALLTVTSGILIIISAVWYMDNFAAMLSHPPQKVKQDFLLYWSPWFFAFALTNASACIMLPKKDGTTQ